MTTSESKGRFLQNESIRINSHNESNRIDSNRELECSTSQTAPRSVQPFCRADGCVLQQTQTAESPRTCNNNVTRRLKADLLVCFKILRGFTDIIPSEFFCVVIMQY